MATTATTSLTLPIPTLSYTTGRTYDVERVPFDNAGEQRFLLSREQGRALLYQYVDVDSATVSQILDVWTATHGPVGVFWATDYQDGTSNLVRFDESAVRQERTIHRQVRTIPLRVVETVA